MQVGTWQEEQKAARHESMYLCTWRKERKAAGHSVRQEIEIHENAACPMLQNYELQGPAQSEERSEAALEAGEPAPSPPATGNPSR